MSGQSQGQGGEVMMATHSPCAWALSRYSMQHNRRRRTILRLFATLLKMGDEINLILCIGVQDVAD